jgi:hypothetical protein
MRSIMIAPRTIKFKRGPTCPLGSTRRVTGGQVGLLPLLWTVVRPQNFARGISVLIFGRAPLYR